MSSSHRRIPVWVPMPQEIEERKMMLRWLQSQGFNVPFITFVMRYDHPRYELVRRMVEKHGAKEAYRRLEPFTQGFPDKT